MSALARTTEITCDTRAANEDCINGGSRTRTKFQYDADNRLCAAVVGGAASCGSPTVVYDGGAAGPGNITMQSGVGTYTYPAAGQPRPHAVTSVTGTLSGSYAYDLNGNMTDRASTGQNITWFSSNYPETISATDTTGAEEVQFQYGPDRQRWQQLYTAPGTTETTYYVGNGNAPVPVLLEVVISGGVTTYRHYINAGSEPIAVYSRSNSGTNTMNYVLEDHQGGISGIATSSGAMDIDESFTAFGQRRNPATWSGAPTSGDLSTIAGISRQGYTFQTWLGQSMGLNHMNGRVEDAILGRMTSPDPYVPDPTDAQSYNRYSYAINNPLTLIDPSGFDECVHSRKCGGDDGDDDGDGDGNGNGGYIGVGIGTAPSNPTAPPDQLPDVGCEIPPNGPCPAWTPTPPSIMPSPPLFNPQGPLVDPGLAKCLQVSILFCNGAAQNTQPLQSCMFRQGGCTQPLDQPCFGTFAFAGQEADFGEGSVFVGALVESTVPGLDVGPLYEGAVGGEGPVAGLATTTSATTGTRSAFGFLGGSLSSGPLAGLQVGIIYSNNEFGVYLESHKGFNAGGGGFAFSNCAASSGGTSSQ